MIPDDLRKLLEARAEPEPREESPEAVFLAPVADPFLLIPGEPGAELLLRADRPAELVLEGPPDLVAESFTVVLKGRPSLTGTAAERLDLLAGRTPPAQSDGDRRTWARRVSVSIGDDTPLQVLPAVLGPGVSAATRELAAPLNAAWAAAAAAAAGQEQVRVAIRLLSIEHGRVGVTAKGRWSRIRSGAYVVLPLDPFQPAEIEVPVSGAAASVELDLTADLGSGVRQRLMDSSSAGPPFRVRVDDQLHVSQIFRLANADIEPGPARELGAVWVCLPRVPAAPANLGVAITARVDGEVRGLGGYQVEVPSDSAALVTDPRGAGQWFRAAAPAPIRLDAALAVAPLRVELSSRAGGLDLVHLPATPAAPAAPLEGDQWKVRATRGMGAADYRRLAGSPAWLPRLFQGLPARILCDVELVALPTEHAELIRVGVSEGSLLTPPLPGLRFTGHRVAVPASDTARGANQDVRRIVLHSSVRGEIKVQARSVLSAGPPKVASGEPIFDPKEFASDQSQTVSRGNQTA